MRYGNGARVAKIAVGKGNLIIVVRNRLIRYDVYRGE